MRTVEAAIEIRARPEAVFDLIHDYARRLEWDPFLKEACLLEGAEAAGPGVKARCTARNGFGGLAMETIYLSFDRPVVAAVKMTKGPAVLETFAASLRQEDVGSGLTRVTYRFNFSTRPRWLRALAGPIASVLFLREVRQRLEALKSYMERRSDDLYSLPADLPAPTDDGACGHLPGLEVPPLDLPNTDGRSVRLGASPTRWTVVYAYPRTGVPTQDSPPGWDEIPGARGCTPQNCAFRDHYADLQRLGATVYGLSTQSTEYQREMAERLHLPYPILSDARLELTHALRLPTFRYGDWTLLKRLSLILEGSRIVHVIYPVFPSTADAPAVTAWLRARVG